MLSRLRIVIISFTNILILEFSLITSITISFTDHDIFHKKGSSRYITFFIEAVTLKLFVVEHINMGSLLDALFNLIQELNLTDTREYLSSVGFVTVLLLYFNELPYLKGLKQRFLSRSYNCI